jgi:hypothetical protein
VADYAAVHAAVRSLGGDVRPAVDDAGVGIANFGHILELGADFRFDAVAGYREALRGWRALGLTFDEALAGLDVAILLNPSEREMTESPAVIEAARATFVQLGARPFAARLETADIAS